MMLLSRMKMLHLFRLPLILMFQFVLFIPTANAFTNTDFLKTNGTVIKNNSGTGNIVNLRGTNLGSWMLREDWMSPLGAPDEYSMRQILQARFHPSVVQSMLNSYLDTWFQASDLDNIKQMGMNVVRVPLYWEDFMYSNGYMKTDAQSFSRLDWLVKEANARNIYVILDFHGTPGSACPWQSCGRENTNQLWTNATYQNWTMQIWQRLARHYNNNPTIAAYDLLNEPLVSMGNPENATQIKQKMDYLNRLYAAVRAIDANHTIQIAVFYDWWAAFPPSTYGWKNVVYQTHHYQTTNYDDWNLTNTAIDNWLKALAYYQRTWNVPIYAGEYSFGQNDLMEKWLNGLNALNASWTNWTYKAKGGGNWGFYHNNYNPSPDLKNDTAETIAAKWSKFSTANFAPNTPYISLVKKYSTASAVTPDWSSLKASANGLYISADDEGRGPLIANRTKADDWERFKLIKNNDGTVSLWSMANNKYVQVDMNKGAILMASATFIGAWEKYWLVTNAAGQVALKAVVNNKFVSANLNDGGKLYANANVADSWENFTLATS